MWIGNTVARRKTAQSTRIDTSSTDMKTLGAARGRRATVQELVHRLQRISPRPTGESESGSLDVRGMT